MYRGGKMPVVAMMYDFDKTLSTKDMQEYSFIPKLGLTAQEFWAQSNTLAKEQKMDRILSYMYMMVRMSKDKHQPIRREDFVALGKRSSFIPGWRTGLPASTPSAWNRGCGWSII